MPAKLTVIDGLGGIPEPLWAEVFDDELDQAAARELWRLAVQDLSRNEKLASANAHTIKRMVQHQVLHDIAFRHVIEQGAVIPAPRTKTPQYNPWFTVMQSANAMVAAAEAELTLSPRRRNSGGKVKKGGTQAVSAAAYLPKNTTK